MKTLTHNQQIRTDMDEYEPVNLVGTIEGNCIDYPNDDLAETTARCDENGWDKAWVNKLGAILVADYPGKAAAHAKKHQAYVDATYVRDGERVSIEGREYIVKYVRPDVSDPVHFIAVN